MGYLQNEQGYLRDARVYLSGPIENDTSDDWRTPIREMLRSFGVRLYDPSLDPKQKLREEIAHCKKVKDFVRLRQIMRGFVTMDLTVVRAAHFIVACLPQRVPTTGTHHEIIVANESKKPTLLYCPTGVENLPDWYFGIIKPEHLFGSLGALTHYLRRVDDGLEKEADRWFFLYNGSLDQGIASYYQT